MPRNARVYCIESDMQSSPVIPLVLNPFARSCFRLIFANSLRTLLASIIWFIGVFEKYSTSFWSALVCFLVTCWRFSHLPSK